MNPILAEWIIYIFLDSIYLIQSFFQWISAPPPIFICHLFFKNREYKNTDINSTTNKRRAEQFII